MQVRVDRMFLDFPLEGEKQGMGAMRIARRDVSLYLAANRRVERAVPARNLVACITRSALRFGKPLVFECPRSAYLGYAVASIRST